MTGKVDTYDDAAPADGTERTTWKQGSDTVKGTLAWALAYIIAAASFTEAVDDRVAALLTAGTGVSISYDDGAGTLTINFTGGSGDITDFAEAVQDVVGAFASASGLATVTYNDGAGTLVIGVANEAVQDMIASFLTAGTYVTLTYDDAGNTLTVTLDAATAAQYRSNTANKVLTTDKVWAAADYVALTDAATVAVDLSAGINFTLGIGGNRTLGNPSNTKNGQTGVIVITQDGTGSRTLAYSSSWKFAGGTAPVLTTTAGAVDWLFYQVLDSTHVYATLAKDVK